MAILHSPEVSTRSRPTAQNCLYTRAVYEIRTRFAPAPSGSLHVGSARTALYNWLIARRVEGTFVLRIEDTDPKRVSEEAYQALLMDMRWLGLDWDEGPEVEGPYGPYRQSERAEHYRDVAARLLEGGAAYRCYCTSEELAERRKHAHLRNQPPGYDGRCRNLTTRERERFKAEDRPFLLRFRVPEGRIIRFHDAIRGSVTTETKHIPDFVILRTDQSPTYMLATTIDDAMMEISHIIRGEDLLPATPRQLLLRRALGIKEVPVFGHVPLIVDDKGRPLSKRWGDVAVSTYREQGFLPEAMINYLALLGWSYDDRSTIFTIGELTEKFSLHRVGKNPAMFDVAKLEWLNGHYIRSSSPQKLAEALVPVCRNSDLSVDSPERRAKLAAVAPLLAERTRVLSEVPPMIRFLFEEVAPNDKASKALEGRAQYLAAVLERLEALDQWKAAAIEDTLRSLAQERGLKPRDAFQPIRAAVTGTLVSPPLFESLEILGRKTTLVRLRRNSPAE